METSDRSHLPQPVHDAVLHLLETLLAAFTRAPAEGVRTDMPAAESPARFPRSALELQVLEALEALDPLPASPVQVAALIHQPRQEVLDVLRALATLGTIQHPGNAQYRHRQPGEDVQRPPKRLTLRERRMAVSPPPADELRPSARFTGRIAALCAPNTRMGEEAWP